MIDKTQKKFNSDWEFTDDNKLPEANFHKFENEGDEFIGELIGISEGANGTVYSFKTPDNKIEAVGGYKALEKKITEEDITKKFKIVFKGKVKSQTSKYSYMTFEVYKK